MLVFSPRLIHTTQLNSSLNLNSTPHVPTFTQTHQSRPWIKSTFCTQTRLYYVSSSTGEKQKQSEKIKHWHLIFHLSTVNHVISVCHRHHFLLLIPSSCFLCLPFIDTVTFSHLRGDIFKFCSNNFYVQLEHLHENRWMETQLVLSNHKFLHM